MRARPAAAGPGLHGRLPGQAAAATPAPPPGGAGSAGGQASARAAAAAARASARRDRQRHNLRPLGWAFIAAVVVASLQSDPGPGLQGGGLAVSLILAAYAVAVWLAVITGWTRRGKAAQVAVIAAIGGCGVALAALQPHGPTGLAASMAIWIAAVRLPPAPAAAAAGAITIALGTVIALTQRPAFPAVTAAALLCLLLAVTGQFIRRGREDQDRSEMLLAQLQDAREAEAGAAAVAERGRIAGELHDVLAHSLSGLAIQLQGARRLADREQVTDELRAVIRRSAELAREGLADARQAVGALRGDRLPGVDQISALIEDFRRNTGADAVVCVEGTPRPLGAEASLALYRGAQEALTNITRYAPGAHVTVTVRYAPGRTVLTVQDQPGPGAGAGPAGGSGPAPLAGAGGGHGLASMRERVRRAGGTAAAGPAGEGWRVEVEVPS